jgi:hypothetical protein
MRGMGVLCWTFPLKWLAGAVFVIPAVDSVAITVLCFVLSLLACDLSRSRRYTRSVSVHSPFGALWLSLCPSPWLSREEI